MTLTSRASLRVHRGWLVVDHHDLRARPRGHGDHHVDRPHRELRAEGEQDVAALRRLHRPLDVRLHQALAEGDVGGLRTIYLSDNIKINTNIYPIIVEWC